jgi:hypothetical protein
MPVMITSDARTARTRSRRWSRETPSSSPATGGRSGAGQLVSWKRGIGSSTELFEMLAGRLRCSARAERASKRLAMRAWLPPAGGRCARARSHPEITG